MRLYSSVEEIVTMCSVKKTWGHGGSHVHTWLPPDDPPPPPPNEKKISISWSWVLLSK